MFANVGVPVGVSVYGAFTICFRVFTAFKCGGIGGSRGVGTVLFPSSVRLPQRAVCHTQRMSARGGF